MRSKFLNGLFLILVLNLLIKPIYILGIDAEMQNRLGSEVYGNYFALLNFSFLLNVLNDIGLSNYYTRYLSRKGLTYNPDFSRVLGIRILLFFAYVGLSLVFAGGLAFNSEELAILLVLLFNQFLVSGIQYSRATFTGTLQFNIEAFVSVLDRVLLISICLYLLFGLEEFGIWSFIMAQSISYGLTFLVSLILIFRKKNRTVSKSTFSKKEIIKKAFPYALLVLLMMFYTRIDAIMIERMLPDGDMAAGKYAQGYRFLDAVNMFALLIAGLLLPVFSSLLSKRTELRQMVSLGARFLLVIGLVVSLFGFNYSVSIMEWRYITSGADSNLNFSYLILSFLPMCMTYLYGTLLTANGSLRQLNIMALFALAVNVLLNWVLITEIGFYGAAIATLVTQWWAAIIQLFLAHRILKIGLSKTLFMQLLILGSVITISHQVMDYFDLGVLITLAIELILVFIAVISTKLLRFDDVKAIILLKRKEE